MQNDCGCLLESVVTKHSHRGIAPYLLWMKFELLLNGILERLKIQVNLGTHSHTHARANTHTVFITLPFNSVIVFYCESQKKLSFNANLLWFFMLFSGREVEYLCLVFP